MQNTPLLPLEAAPEDTAPAAIPPAATSLARGSLWVIGGRMVGIGGTALISILLPWSLSPADCGAFLLAQNWIGLLSLLAAAGLPLAIIKLLGEGLARRNAWRTASALTHAARIMAVTTMLVALAACAIVGFNELGPQRLLPGAWWLALCALGIILFAWQGVLVEGIRGLGDLRLASLFAGGYSGGPVGTLLFAIGLIVLGLIGHATATQALGWYAATLAATLPWIGWRLRKLVRQSPLEQSDLEQSDKKLPHSKEEGYLLSEVLALSLPICATQLLAFVSLSADLPIAGFFCTSDEIALLGQSRRLLLLIQLPTQMAVLTVLPTVARLYAEGNLSALQRLVRQATTFSALFSVMAGAVLLVAPGAMLGLLFGDFYRQGAPLLTALAIGQLIAAHNGMAGYVLLMAGRQRTVVAINAATALLMLSIGTLAAVSGGIWGLAIAAAIVLALQSSLEWWFARRLLGVWTHVDWLIFAKQRC